MLVSAICKLFLKVEYVERFLVLLFTKFIMEKKTVHLDKLYKIKI